MTENTTEDATTVYKFSENIQPSSNRIKINITKTVKPQSISVITSSSVVDKNATENVGPGASTTIGGGVQMEAVDEGNVPDIEFEYKENLRNVKFTKIDKIKTGYETSGLCSIM